MTDKEIYLKLFKRGKVSIGRLRNRVFPCTTKFGGSIDPKCYKFLQDTGPTPLTEIEDLYYSYIMEFVKKEYPERVFALWMTSKE